MQAKLIVTFDHLNEADFLSNAGTIVAAMTGNAHYPEPWSPQVPRLAQLTAAFNASYQNGYHSSPTRGANNDLLTAPTDFRVAHGQRHAGHP